MKKRLINGLLIATIGASLFVTGCGNKTEKTPSNQENTIVEEKEAEPKVQEEAPERISTADSLKIGILNKQVAPMVDAYYQFTEKEVGDDVKVERIQFTTGNEAITALVNGDIDVVFGVGSLPVVSSAANGFDFEIISYGTSAGSTYVIVSDESGITDVESLKGHSIGLQIGTASHQNLLEILGNAGLTEEDVEFVGVDAQAGQAAIASGDLDAAILLYFQAAALLESGDAVKIAESGEGATWVLANKGYANANPEIISGFITGLHNAGAYVEENTQAVAEEVGEANDLEANTFLGLVNQNVKQNFLTLGDDTSKELLTSAYQFSLDQELIENEIDILSYFNDSYSKDAGK